MNLLISTFRNDIKLLCRKGLLSSFILLAINCSQSMKLEGQILSFFPFAIAVTAAEETVSMEKRTDTGHKTKPCSPGSVSSQQKHSIVNSFKTGQPTIPAGQLLPTEVRAIPV